MSKQIKLINGEKVLGNYNTSGGSGHYGIQNKQEQMKHGLSKLGFLALRHKESGDILVPEMRSEWAKGVTHNWWDSKDNMKRTSGSWSWNTSIGNKVNVIKNNLKKHFRSKASDYELILFELKDGEILYYTWQGGDLGYAGPCPLDREDMDKIQKIVVLTEKFCNTTKEKVIKKNVIATVTIKEV
jgi:hypothetical protein